MPNSRWIAACGMTFVAYLWVWAAMPVMAIPDAVVDDALFVRNARLILSGQWLGAYNQLTLAKGVGFPLWLALLAGIGISALLGQAMLYAGAALLLVRGLARWIRHEGALFAIWLLLLANPALYSMATLRILREGFYTPMLLLILGLILWWVRLSAERARRGWMLVAIALGFSLGIFHLTREETVWILPFLLGCLVLRVVALRRGEAVGGWRREALMLGLCAASAALPVLVVSALNARHYAYFGTVEFRDGDFIRAYGALARLGPDAPSLIVLPRAVLPALFAASPAAAELRPYFELGRGQDYINVGCATYRVEPCDGELRAGWFMWALRDATVISANHWQRKAVRDFNRRLAAEVNAACDSGALTCQPRRDSLAPPFRTAYVGPSLEAGWRLLAVARAMVSPPRPESLRSIYFAPNDFTPRASAFLELTRAALYVDVLRSDQLAPEYLPFSLPVQKATILLRLLAGADRVWAWVAGPFQIGGFLAFLLLPWLWWRGAVPACWPLFFLCAGGYLLFATRVALLAYLDTVAIPSVNLLYLSPAMPPFLLSSALAWFLALRSLWRWRRASGRASKLV